MVRMTKKSEFGMRKWIRRHHKVGKKLEVGNAVGIGKLGRREVKRKSE